MGETTAIPAVQADPATKLAVCHSLDLRGRTLCGATLGGTRKPHPIGDCAAYGHPRCATCDTLMMCEGDDAATEAQEAA